MNAREAVLASIHAALGPAPAIPDVPRAYRRAGDLDADVERFCERVAEYRATVHRTGAADLPAALAGLVGGGRVGAPPGLESRPDGAVTDDPPLSPAELDQLDAVVTGCALAIAETGTIILDGGPESGRRALTLVPDRHICIVRTDQIVASVPDAIARVDAARPLTLVSGPSATSDIELERVEGVHGPRLLDVIVVDSD